MMGYGNGSGWIWMVIGAVVLIGLVLWAVIAISSRRRSRGGRAAAGASVATDGNGRARAR